MAAITARSPAGTTVPPAARQGAPWRTWVRPVLLGGGIVASLLYVATTVLAAMRWEGYSATDQSISELFAIDVPSAPLVIPLFLAYSGLMIAFGVGVWTAAGGKRALRVVAGLMVVDQVRGIVGTLFAPMHLRGVEGTSTDILHIMLTSATVLLSLLILGFGATAFGPWFRRYSIGTILVLLVFGAVAGLNGPRMAANLPTPWFGVEERISVFSYLLWVAVLAGALLRPQRERLPRRESIPPTGGTPRAAVRPA